MFAFLMKNEEWRMGCAFFTLHVFSSRFILHSSLFIYLVEAALSMLIDVETLFLNSLVNSQTCNLLDTEEQYDTCNGSPCVDGEDTKALCTEESESASVKSTAVEGEQTGEDGAENTAYTMH